MDQVIAEPAVAATAPETPQLTSRDVRRFAMDLMARREHSRFELAQKLRKKCARVASAKDVASANDNAGTQDIDGLVEEVLDHLASDQLLSDRRFVESYISYRQRSGFGPLKVNAELRERGISDELARAAMQPLDDSWHAIASRERRKKFGDDLPATKQAIARQQRFLQYRGFSIEHIRSAMRRDAHGLC